MHRHKDLAENGIKLKIVTPEDVAKHPIEYIHRDDYYIFGLMVRGTMIFDIDFEQQAVGVGTIGLIRPGQVHRFLGWEDFEGWMLMVESGMVCDRYKLIFEETSFSGKTLWLPNQGLDELRTLYQLIHNLDAKEEDMSLIRKPAPAFLTRPKIAF